MKTRTYSGIKKQRALAKHNLLFFVFLALYLIFPVQIKAQTVTSPQVPFLQRTSAATPAQKIYNVKGDFTMLGNTNLTLVNYGNNTDNQSKQMKYVDIDGDANTWNSSMATLELSNSGENSAVQNCSTILFAGLYWTGKSDDADNFTVTKLVEDTSAPMQQFVENYEVNHQGSVAHSDYTMTVTRRGSSNNYYPRYTFTSTVSGQPTVEFEVNNSFQVIYRINGGSWITPGNQIIYNNTPNDDSKEVTFNPVTIYAGSGIVLTVDKLRRDEDNNENSSNTEGHSFAYGTITYDGFPLIPVNKNFDKKIISIKGPGATTYTAITAKLNGANSEIRFPGSANSGIFVGYQEITAYVKTHGPGAYTVADIALTEGSNSNPGLSGGWVMVVIYENPLMKSRAVTLFDGYAFVDGQLSGGGEFGTIPISGFTTVGSGPVNMKLGVMASEGDVNLTGDYLAVQKLNANPAVYNTTNYLTLNHAGNSTNNFFNSSIFPFPTAGNSNPNLVNNTGVDFSMFTIPNANNSVIANNQTATTFRFGSSSDVFTIFGFAMSVDSYIPEPKGLISVNSINNVTNPLVLNALPGQTINYSLNITNEGTEATNNTIISIPIPATAIFNTGTIVYNTYHGFNTTNIPYFDSATNKIIWDLGTLPITAGHPEYIYADLSFTLNVTTDCDIIINAGCNPEVSLETGTITGTGGTSGSSFTKYFFQGYDDTSCHLPIDGSIKVAIDASSCFSSMAGPDQITSCGGESVTLSASTGTSGIWDIVSGPAGGGEIFSNITSPTSTFYSPNLGAYTLRWTTSCATTDNVVITFELCNVVNFDGIDDHINFKDNFNLNSGNFSIEAWVKSNAANGNTQTIMSKHLSPSSTDGYDLRLVNNLISFNWNNNSITAAHAIDTNRWYHIAVTFDGANFKLYIDGILEKTTSGVNPTSNSVDFILGAMSQNTNSPYNYYNGWTDELRMWNVSLTVEQIHQMMNQEITNDGSGNVKGVIVPINISGLSWTNLAGYYQMNRTSDIINGYLVDKSGNSKNGKLKGIYVQEPDSAPLPYTTIRNGDWTNKTASSTPWTYGDSVWDYPNSFGINGTTKIDWNIVQTSHNITSGDKDITVLGLISTAGTLTIAEPTEILDENNSGQSLRVTHYMELDGAIDLVGESQLLQDEGSILDQDSGGYIERDQQGTANSYNYNYWSSSVGSISGNTALRGTGVASTNASHKLSDVLKDGTNSGAPGAISFNTPYTWADNAYAGLKRISSYWLYTFNGTNGTYSQWHSINEYTSLIAGEGYTMKGTSGKVSILDKQNYVFKGKPNNGNIKLSIALGNDRLIGNPYPSAIDANEFILDNLSGRHLSGNNIFNGALYFWDHFGEINTHILREYVGGYATRNLIDGVKAISNDYRINANLAEGSKIPGQYIPVNQGFFVITSLDESLTGIATVSGGDIIFKNSQRVFKTEASGNSVFMKTANTKAGLPTGEKKGKDNSENNGNTNKNAKIWLQFNSPTGYHRQLLVGVNNNATNHFDLGYDAPIADIGKEDMFWTFDGSKFVIQGVDNFDRKQELPLGIVIFKAGLTNIKIDKTENLDKKVSVYIKDKLTGLSYEISKNPFEITLEPGEYLDRFSVTFQPTKKKGKDGKDKEDENDDDDDDDDDHGTGHHKQNNADSFINAGEFLIYMNNTTAQLQIAKPVDAEILDVNLYNYLGQNIKTWNTNLNASFLSLTVNTAAGAYIVQINTKNGSVVNKVIVE